MHGLTILNTREASAAAELTASLSAHGATVVERPMLAFAPPDSWCAFDDRLARLEGSHWIVFTSATAVRFALERLAVLGKPASLLAQSNIAAVGSGTAASLERHGLAVALVPPENYQGEGLLEALLLKLKPGAAVWLPRAEKARETLVDGLQRAGIQAEATPVYRTVMPEGGLGEAGKLLLSDGLDWIVFTSSSTVEHFFAMLPPEAAGHLRPSRPNIACLGAVTALTARDHGLEVAIVPERQNLAGLVSALVAHAERL